VVVGLSGNDDERKCLLLAAATVSLLRWTMVLLLSDLLTDVRDGATGAKDCDVDINKNAVAVMADAADFIFSSSAQRCLSALDAFTFIRLITGMTTLQA